MSLTLPRRSALSALFARTIDNSAYYTALTTAEGLREITEMAGVKTDPRYRLIHVDNRLGTAECDEFEIALIDDIELSVAYYEKVMLLRVPEVSSRKLAHSLIWRSANSRHLRALRDISQKVHFNYIINDFDILIAADSRIDGGNFYWHRQVSRAIENGLQVSLYDATKQALWPIATQRALNDLQDQAWALSNHESLQAIISNSKVLPLPKC